MAIKHAEDEYGADGSVPEKVGFDPAQSLNVRANPNDFGGQIGEAVQGAGKTAEDLAVQYGGMVNDTLATNADANLAVKIGQIKGDYLSKSGMEAYNSYPQYQNDIQQAFQDGRQGLTLGAQKAYEMIATRTVANHLADGSGYAAQQLKQANVDSYSSLQNVSVQRLLDPSVASNPARTGEVLGTLVHAEQSKIDLDHPGLKTDPETGELSFDESKPEGTQLKTQYQQNVDSLMSQARVTQFNTLSRPDVMGVLPAYDLYKEMRASFPPQAQVALDSSFAPKVLQAHVNNATSSAMNDAAQAHAEMLYNPKSSDLSDAIHQQESGGKPHDYQIQPGTFAQYAKPGESPDNPKDQDAVYGRIMDDLKTSYPNDPARQAVAYFSGKGNVAPAGNETPRGVAEQARHERQNDRLIERCVQKLRRICRRPDTALAPQQIKQNEGRCRNHDRQIV